MGELDKAAELFDRTYLPFVREPFGVSNSAAIIHRKVLKWIL